MPARPAHINIWGCLLFAAWVASFGVYIAVRAAKAIDRHSNIFAYQVPCCEAHGQTYALLSQQYGYCTKKTFRTRIETRGLHAFCVLSQIVRAVHTTMRHPACETML